MGFVRQPTIYRLRFDDQDMAGLVVRARSAPVGQFMALARLASMGADEVKAEGLGKLDELFGGFASCLIDWNLETSDGQPVPATLEGLYTQDTDFVLAIIAAWVEGIAGVPAPLGAGSSDGGRSLERSIPMEPLSANHGSSKTPNLS